MKKVFQLLTLLIRVVRFTCLLLITHSIFSQSGNIFRDFNANGLQDTHESFASGVLVKTYNSVG